MSDLEKRIQLLKEEYKRNPSFAVRLAGMTAKLGLNAPKYIPPKNKPVTTQSTKEALF